MNVPALPGYVSVQEAAGIIGCSESRIYQYIKSGRLSAQRVGHMLVLPAKEVQSFQRVPAGRQRREAPPWRRYRDRARLFATTVQVQVQPGMQEELRKKLAAVEPEQHTFTGNIARYVIGNGDTVQIVLIWKSTEMPDDTTRQQDLSLFQQAFDDVLNWETAKYAFDDVLLHT